MIVRGTTIEGAFVLEPEPLTDERGFFARVWCRDTLGAHGLTADVVQSNVAFNARAGTLRGLHFQVSPHEEVKVVRCTSGAVFDAIVDLRPTSDTYLEWLGIELTAENRAGLYVPAGVAHGYQTLVDGTETVYFHSTPFAPDAAGGVRWDDPAFGIDWPAADERIMSPRDAAWPDYELESPFF